MALNAGWKKKEASLVARAEAAEQAAAAAAAAASDAASRAEGALQVAHLTCHHICQYHDPSGLKLPACEVSHAGGCDALLTSA